MKRGICGIILTYKMYNLIPRHLSPPQRFFALPNLQMKAQVIAALSLVVAATALPFVDFNKAVSEETATAITQQYPSKWA